VRSVRRARPPVEVAAGERLLAWAPVSSGGWVGGTRDALYLPTERRVVWEEVQAADWDREQARLLVSEVGTWGEPRLVHDLVLAEPDRGAQRLLNLVRERITASVLLSRHVPIEGRRGVRVIGRRAPSGRSDVQWAYEYDAGIDPDDPFVQTAAAEALAAAKADVGLS
jgi:hypothetical protein